MMTQNNEWHDRAAELYEKGEQLVDIFRVLKETHPWITYEAIRSYIRRRKDRMETPAQPQPVVENEDNSENKVVTEYKNGETTITRIIELAKGTEITPDVVMKAHGFDTNQWEIVTYKNSQWQSQKQGGDVMDLYQSKITVKPKKSPLPSFEEIQKHFESFKPTYVPKEYNPVSPKADTMVEINIADLHLGKLAWNRETGESYDYKIAQKRFYDIIDQEIARMKLYPVEEILFVWSNDFFNSDGINETTTGGTPQDNDLRWQKMFFVGVDLLVNAITKLSEVAPVKTFLVASNHSRQVEFYAISYLFAWFKDDPRVTVDCNCKTRFYYRYGTNLIGFSHSSYEKKHNLPLLMQVEAKEDWAKTSYREFHLAHYHCEQVDEKGGIIFRWLPSVTGPDAWHESCGYLGAVQRSYSFVWNKKIGLVGINIDYPSDRFSKRTY